MLSFMTDEVTILVTGETQNARNESVFGIIDEIPLKRCSVQPGASKEVLGNRDTVSILWTVYAPYQSDVRAVDRIRWQGTEYAVNGEPMKWRSPLGTLSHTVIALERWVENG